MNILHKLKIAIKRRNIFSRYNGIPSIPEGTEPPKNMVFVLSRVEDFDSELNEVWRMPENKSYARNLFCNWCNSQVMMSNGAYKIFLDYPRPLQCSKCHAEKDNATQKTSSNLIGKNEGDTFIIEIPKTTITI